MRTPRPSFVAEFPLRTTAADDATLGKRLDAARQLYNACLDEALKRLGLMRQSKDWQRARTMARNLGKDVDDKTIPNRERTALYKSVGARFGFSANEIQKHADHTRDACWIGDHMGSHDAQTTSLRAFSAVQMHAFGKRGRPRFKAFGRWR